MANFDFKFSVLCPDCGSLAEFSHFSIEVIADGIDLGTCECGAIIQCHLTSRAADGATCPRCQTELNGYSICPKCLYPQSPAANANRSASLGEHQEQSVPPSLDPEWARDHCVLGSLKGERYAN